MVGFLKRIMGNAGSNEGMFQQESIMPTSEHNPQTQSTPIISGECGEERPLRSILRPTKSSEKDQKSPVIHRSRSGSSRNVVFLDEDVVRKERENKEYNSELPISARVTSNNHKEMRPFIGLGASQQIFPVQLPRLSYTYQPFPSPDYPMAYDRRGSASQKHQPSPMTPINPLPLPSHYAPASFETFDPRLSTSSLSPDRSVHRAPYNNSPDVRESRPSNASYPVQRLFAAKETQNFEGRRSNLGSPRQPKHGIREPIDGKENDDERFHSEKTIEFERNASKSTGGKVYAPKKGRAPPPPIVQTNLVNPRFPPELTKAFLLPSPQNSEDTRTLTPASSTETLRERHKNSPTTTVSDRKKTSKEPIKQLEPTGSLERERGDGDSQADDAASDISSSKSVSADVGVQVTMPVEFNQTQLQEGVSPATTIPNPGIHSIQNAPMSLQAQGHPYVRQYATNSLQRAFPSHPAQHMSEYMPGSTTSLTDKKAGKRSLNASLKKMGSSISKAFSSMGRSSSKGKSRQRGSISTLFEPTNGSYWELSGSAFDLSNAEMATSQHSTEPVNSLWLDVARRSHDELALNNPIFYSADLGRSPHPDYPPIDHPEEQVPSSSARKSHGKPLKAVHGQGLYNSRERHTPRMEAYLSEPSPRVTRKMDS